MMKKAVAISLAAAGAMGENPVIHPPQIVPSGWEPTGENADLTGRMDVLVGLRRSNKDKMQKIFDESSAPGHHRYLEHASWQEMGDMIRPSKDAIGATIGMLAANGATDISLANHGDYIKASVPADKLETLTEGTFQTFRQASTGRLMKRLMGGVKLPAAVAKYVETFTGLHGFPLDAKPVTVGNTTAGNVVTPSVINKAYGIDQQSVTKSGKPNIQAIGQFQGQYVSPTDLSKFCQAFDATADCSIQKFVGKNTGSRPGIESMLDTEYITGIAEGFTTWVYSYPGMDFCSDLLTWAGDVAAESSFPYVVSLSYGSQMIDFCDKTTRDRLSEDVQKLGAMGITVVIASGDDGSGGMSRQGSNNGKLSPSFPASIPTALAVGATFFQSGLSGVETATTQFGSGGGFSYDFDRPSYQTAAIETYMAKNPLTGTKSYAETGRGSPDVSLLGEQFEVYTSGTFGGLEKEAVGGTSASTPSWGAIISLLNEECLSASGGKKTLGFVNPLFYQNADAFNDVTIGSNAVGENAGNGWKCTEGWDAATGLGTPRFTSLQSVVRTSCASSPPTPPSPPPSPPSPPPSPPSPPPSSDSHYEDPKDGCKSDEVDIQIQGVSGAVCSPKCTLGIFCPSDVPTGVTAAPQCALQDSSSGKKYCALICSPGSNDSQCGTGSCKSLQGVGICTYDDADSILPSTSVEYVGKAVVV